MENIERILKEELGFTLIEVMITTVIMSIALVAILSANAAMAQSSEVLFQRTVAIQNANQVFERMRNTAISGTFPGNVTTAYPHNGTVSGFAALTNEVVRVTYADRNGDGNALTDNPLDATVTVTWSDNNKRSATSSLRSLVTQR